MERKHKRSATIPVMGRSFCWIVCPFCATRCKAYIWSMSGGGKRCPTCKAKHLSHGVTVQDKPERSVTVEQCRAVLDKDSDLTEDDLDLLAIGAADFGHEATCPRKMVGAAECLCIRSEILSTLDEHCQGT